MSGAAPVIEDIEGVGIKRDNNLPNHQINNDLREPMILYNNTRALGKYAKTYKLETFEKNYLAIFNQENVDGFEPRVGTEKDVEALDRTFSQFGFEVHEHKNLTKDEIMEELKVFSEKDFTDYGCVAIAVLTHGTHGGLLRAKDMPYCETEIIKHFKTVKNPTLITKPKILILQACRGVEGATRGVVVKSSFRIHKDDLRPSDAQQGQAYTLPIESDILVLHSSYPGNPSYREERSGSWFIRTLCVEINRSHHTQDLESILIDVKRKVAVDMEDEVYDIRTRKWHVNKQMPVVTSTLLRRLYLRRYGESEVMFVRLETLISFMECFEYMKNCLRYHLLSYYNLFPISPARCINRRLAWYITFQNSNPNKLKVTCVFPTWSFF